MSMWTGLRNAAETGLTLGADYYTGGLASLANGWQSTGSQQQLGSTAGQIGQVGASLAGWGVGSDTTGIPQSPLVAGGLAALGYGAGAGGGGAAAGLDTGAGGYSPLSMGEYGGNVGTDQQLMDQLAMQNTAVSGYGGGVGMGIPAQGLPAAGATPGGGGMGLMQKALPIMGAANLVGGLYGLYASGQGAKQSKQYQQQIANLEANPSSIQNAPGYQAGLQALRSQEASTGFGGGGKEQVDLLNYGSTAYNQQIQTLNQLAQGAQANVPTATGSIGGIGAGLGMMYAGGSFDQLLSML